MQTVLITGFEPFGGEPVNPALEAIRRLEKSKIEGAKIVTRALPVVKEKAISYLVTHINEVRPDLVLAVGQAGGRPELSVERVAINVDDYRIKDNEGNQPIDEAIVPGGPAAYWARLPIKAMVEAAKQGGVPAGVSNSAGTFVCNHLFYGLMHHLAKQEAMRGGFIHIPYLPEQAVRNPGQPSMALETIVRGLELFIEAALKYREDLKQGAGTIC